MDLCRDCISAKKNMKKIVLLITVGLVSVQLSAQTNQELPPPPPTPPGIAMPPPPPPAPMPPPPPVVTKTDHLKPPLPPPTPSAPKKLKPKKKIGVHDIEKKKETESAKL